MNCAGIFVACPNPDCDRVVAMRRGHNASYCCTDCLNHHAAIRQGKAAALLHTSQCAEHDRRARETYEKHYGVRSTGP